MSILSDCALVYGLFAYLATVQKHAQTLKGGGQQEKLAKSDFTKNQLILARSPISQHMEAAKIGGPNFILNFQLGHLKAEGKFLWDIGFFVLFGCEEEQEKMNNS